MAEQEAEHKYAPQEEGAIMITTKQGEEVIVYPDTFLFKMLEQDPKLSQARG